jgi:hypothetical protein
VQHKHVDNYKRWALYLDQQEWVFEVVEENQKHKKKKCMFPSQITRFFGSKIPYLKNLNLV